jgi:hypothetical protein
MHKVKIKSLVRHNWLINGSKLPAKKLIPVKKIAAIKVYACSSAL